MDLNWTEQSLLRPDLALVVVLGHPGTHGARARHRGGETVGPQEGCRGSRDDGVGNSPGRSGPHKYAEGWMHQS